MKTLSLSVAALALSIPAFAQIRAIDQLVKEAPAPAAVVAAPAPAALGAAPAAAVAIDDSNASGYRPCRDRGNAHGVCLGAQGGYEACRDRGNVHGVCLSAEAGYRSCRDRGNGHGVCLGAD